jgi:hydrogenase expression/formation protein HypC
VCLAVPLRIDRLLGSSRAVAERDGIELEIDVSLVRDAQPGAYVIVHAGFAIQVVEEEDAAERLELFREIAEAAGEEI